MKKRSLFTLALMGAALMFTTSCSDDEGEDDAPLGPTLVMTESFTGSTGGDIEITQGSTLEFDWESRKGEKDLDIFSVSVSGSNAVNPLPTSYEGYDFPYEIENAVDEIYLDTLAFNTAGVNTGSTVYTFTVTDKAGLSKSVTYDVTVVPNTTDLSDATAFLWTRVGSAPGTGLETFGLKWTSNTSTSAVVAIDGNTIMVDLGSTAWTDLETQEDLDAAISAGTTITQYTGVSVTAPTGTYNDVLGVTHNGVNYILHITQSAVTTGGSGTTVTISGEYKQ